ncbi:MAG: TolC family protein [Gammaproteobacteria bacterium]|nr:TolC family protein [Gammaproteobacteria bacterium]
MKRAFVALAAALVVGCVSYHPRPVDLSRQAWRLENRRLDAPAPARYATRFGVSRWPPQRWTRGDLLLAALFYSPDIATARSRLLVTRADEITARQYPNPQLTLGGEYALAAGSAGIAPWLYGVLVRVLLPQTHLRHAQRLQAHFYTQAAGWQLADSVWSVRSRLRQALLTARYAEQAGAVLDRQACDAQRLAELLQTQVQAGETAAPQARLAQAQALATAQQRDAMRGRAAAARHNMAAVIGVPVAALPVLAPIWSDWASVPAVGEKQLQSLKTQALLSRADLARALADYQAAEQALRIEVDRQYPGVEVEPGYVWDHGVRKLPLELRFNPPIFNQNQGPIAQAKARRAQAGARLEAVQAQILAEIAAARDRSRRAAAIARRFKQQQLPLAERQLQAARQHFDLGESDRSALLAARIAAEQTRLAALRADFQAQAARGALEDALHHPFNEAEIALTARLTHPTTADASP